MKKIIILTVFLVAIITTSQSWAQEKGKIRVGAALAMGTKAAINDTGNEKLGMGINIGGDYFVTDVISISPSFTTFFKSSVNVSGFDFSIKASSFNIDGKYYFLTDEVNVYGLAGLSFASAKVETTFDFGAGPQTISVKDNKTGLNIGAGIDYGLSDKLYLNGQLKYNTPLEQLVINLGVGFNIN